MFEDFLLRNFVEIVYSLLLQISRQMVKNFFFHNLKRFSLEVFLYKHILLLFQLVELLVKCNFFLFPMFSFQKGYILDELKHGKKLKINLLGLHLFYEFLLVIHRLEALLDESGENLVFNKKRVPST